MTEPARASITPGENSALWASAHITHLLDGLADQAPPYGSLAWCRLPLAAPHRKAAVVIAAEQWRHQQAEQARLEALYSIDPDAWFREITAEADCAAARLGRTLASTPTWEECRRRRTHRPPKPVTASPDWTPVGIPGRPGWWRHCVNGEQIDLPHYDIETPERRDAA